MLTLETILYVLRCNYTCILFLRYRVLSATGNWSDRRMDKFITKRRRRYDIVFCDYPPITQLQPNIMPIMLCNECARGGRSRHAQNEYLHEHTCAAWFSMFTPLTELL